MPNASNLTGNRYGHLTVLGRVENNTHGGTMWFCRCDCGMPKIVRGTSLTKGSTTSCGCRGRKYRPKAHHRLYNVWLTMNSKCSNPKHGTYKYYGAKGISVCEEWKDFDTFAEWMYSHGYDESLPRGEQTIDRIDGDGNYEPSNCRIISIRDQQRNKANNVNSLYHGKKICATELARTLGVDYELVRVLIAHGYTADQIECVVNMKNGPT